MQKRDILREVFTAAEAAELWGLDITTIKKACAGQKGILPIFTARECRKSRGTWLVTKAAMEKKYGAMPEKQEGER